MKNLYAYNGEFESRLDKFEAVMDREGVIQAMEQHDIDPYTDGMGDMIIKLLAYVTDTNYSLWKKPLIDLTAREMLAFDRLEGMIDRFQKVEPTD